MKALFVSAGYLPQSLGGTEVHAHALARALHGAGHEVAVFCRDGDSARPDYDVRTYVHEGVPVTAVNYNFGDAKDFGWIHRNERIEALEGFKSGKYEVMVATDIAARGIDIAGVSHVINYDIPQHPEDYVHRIGRTGRAERVGDAFTLVTAEEVGAMQDIERFIGQKVARLKIENFPYLYTALFDEGKSTSRVAVRGVRTGRGMSFGRHGRK